MAVPPCFHLAQEVFPQARAQAARELVEQGWSQSRAAEALGISQAMVSKIVAGKGHPAVQDPLALRLARDVVADLRREASGAPSDAWCQTLLAGPPEAGDALRDLLEAEGLLLEAAPVRLVGQIGLGLVRADDEAQVPGDVLAFPGRIVKAGGALVTPVPPQRGASGHLARCLLLLRSHDGGLAALASIRGGTDVRAAADAAGWNVADVDPALRQADDEEAAFRAAVAGGAHVVHDPGSIGFEPCLYVAGPSAVSVTHRLLQLNRILEEP
ncbi:MAG: thiamine-phosphate synthase family protein [Thermoplasmatota archaeon]